MKAVEVQVQAIEGTSLHLNVCHFSVQILKLRDEITTEKPLGQFLVIKTNVNISMRLGARALCPDRYLDAVSWKSSADLNATKPCSLATTQPTNRTSCHGCYVLPLSSVAKCNMQGFSTFPVISKPRLHCGSWKGSCTTAVLSWKRRSWALGEKPFCAPLEQHAWCLLPMAEGEAKAAVRLLLDEITDPNAQQLLLRLAEMCAHLLWGFVPVDKEFCQLQEDSGFLPN